MKEAHDLVERMNQSVMMQSNVLGGGQGSAYGSSQQNPLMNSMIENETFNQVSKLQHEVSEVKRQSRKHLHESQQELAETKARLEKCKKKLEMALQEDKKNRKIIKSFQVQYPDLKQPPRTPERSEKR